MRYITFDPYYTIPEINKFMEVYRNNGFNPDKNMLISIKSPWHRYIQVNDSDIPKFLKFDDVATSSMIYLVHQLIPIYPREEFILQRRTADTEMTISKFIEPEIFKQLRRKNYGIIFRWTNTQDLKEITTKLKNKIYILGTHRGNWKLAFSFDKGVKGLINKDQVIVEKLSSSDYARPGEFEARLNVIMATDKLHNKLMEYPYWDSGLYYPIQRQIPN